MGRAIGGAAAQVARLDAAQGLDNFDGHALAGFVDAEASFFIRPNNGGATWICGCCVTQRADDGDMLADLATVTGLGRLHARPATAASKPQVVWAINGKLECRELARLLRRFPLRGRKRRDFATWAAAIDVWARRTYGSPDPKDHAALAQLAQELRAGRRYVDSPMGERGVAFDDVDDARAYFGGFFSGEGHLGMHAGRARLSVTLRRDDRPLLEALAATFGLGRITDRPAYRSSKPASTWMIGRRAELGPAVELLDAAQLRGRKRREFELWRRAALALGAGARADDSLVREAQAQLSRRRSYVQPAEPPRSHEGGSEAFVEVLRAAAIEAGRPLSSNAYERVRRDHPTWPTRNTIALAFGGWRAALVAAGLRSGDER